MHLATLIRNLSIECLLWPYGWIIQNKHTSAFTCRPLICMFMAIRRVIHLINEEGKNQLLNGWINRNDDISGRFFENNANTNPKKRAFIWCFSALDDWRRIEMCEILFSFRKSKRFDRKIVMHICILCIVEFIRVLTWLNIPSSWFMWLLLLLFSLYNWTIENKITT